MKKVGVFMIVICGLLLVESCGSQEGARAPLPSIVGPRGEILIVCTDAIWNSEVGDTLRDALMKPYHVLPQMHMETFEPMFDLVQKTKVDFNKFWKPHRNIIFLEIADRIDTQEPSVKFYKNRYSMGQIFIEGKARTFSGLAKKLAERQLEMVSLLDDMEVKRSGYISSLSVDEALEERVLEELGVEMNIPKGCYPVRVDSTFTWIDRQMTRLKGSNNHDVQQGFFIHMEPYLGPHQFSLDYLLERRDKLTAEFVSGPTEGSYMVIERGMIPSYDEIPYQGKFAAEIRGLWRMENDWMGGPFYSITIHDPESSMLITVEGYTYAPYFDKRDYMREVAGIVKSARINTKASTLL
jgi:hypothetical protein|tara:strand:+ start:625 stop:1683 length:1059 start_codon:yes stop_codon:yes gene_type:complete